jgi:V/A-type H+-transporting ATPase subunit F
MKKIAFITTPDAEYGFSLTGLTQTAAEACEALTALDTAAADPDTGLIIIDERLVQGDLEERMNEMEKAWPGILLVLPSPEKPAAEEEDYAARLIRRAIGYHVRLNV